MYLIPELKSLPNSIIDDLDEKSRGAFDSFRERCIKENVFDPEKHDPVALFRFFKARAFKIEPALTMWKNAIEWREKNEVDIILDSFVFDEEKEVKKYYLKYYHNVDKFGRPVYYEHLGSINIKMLYKITNPERMLKYHVYEYEKLLNNKLPASSIVMNKRITQTCTILDLKGIHLTELGSVYSVVKNIINVSQDYYPEILGKMFIINSPLLFTATWNIIKGLLDESTTRKISIIGTDYLSQITNVIPLENIPKNLGGTCKCPGGCENSETGPWNNINNINTSG